MSATATSVLPLAAVPASTTGLQLSENSHQGFLSFKTTSHQAWSVSISMNASGIEECLYDSGRRTRSTGKERDTETGLDNFLARYYSGAQGRFTSPDSTSYSRMTNPQSWNLYAYSLGEAMAHELLGHTWGQLFGGAPVGTLGNLRESILAEDQVRRTDPSRGLKTTHGGRDVITREDLDSLRRR